MRWLIEGWGKTGDPATGPGNPTPKNGNTATFQNGRNSWKFSENLPWNLPKTHIFYFWGKLSYKQCCQISG